MAYKRWKAIQNETALDILGNSSMEIVCKLGELMAERGLNQTEVSRLSGIRQPTINEIIHNKKHTINKEHTKILMIVFKLTDISQLYEVRFNNPEELKQIEEEAAIVGRRGITEQQEAILAEYRKKAED